MNRTIPKNITWLEDNQIFVFGSNLGGRHGAGAAYKALKWGAELGRGVGLYGQTYAIPTKNYNIETLPVEDIKPYVEEFIKFAESRQDLEFLVTEIGCGLAGYKPEQIAPLFEKAVNLINVKLPERFWTVLQQTNDE